MQDFNIQPIRRALHGRVHHEIHPGTKERGDHADFRVIHCSLVSVVEKRIRYVIIYEAFSVLYCRAGGALIGQLEN